MQSNTLIIRSYAKINLGLLVKKKRSDGYHNIETIYVPIQLHDKIRLKKIDKGIIIKTMGIPIPVPQEKANLAYKAALLFGKEFGITSGIEILIEKNIPVGAGLGGGSSNAAAVLQGLNLMSGEPGTKKDLYNLALKIGMDVPFFLCGKACYATGRGEILEPIKIPKLNVVLYYPGYPIITKWAYKKIAKVSLLPKDKRLLTNQALSLKILSEKLQNGDLTDLSHYLLNSFEDLVFEHHPDLAEIKQFFLKHGAYAASLAGSGSAIFGLVEKKNIPILRKALKENKINVLFTKSL
jgi:4-diphosphocytidyl-2-C-methyl-D-erythritol kinase|uniref:4-diphosphocytidyl-2-C-methyl-D-erythritol kinase n=1 Tax=candidate division WOR-3 bacterium TaxID=2052148 RepID=A0A7C6A846_UNCW3